jgi:hypothetical protein
MARTFTKAMFGTLLMCVAATADPVAPSFNLIPNLTVSALFGPAGGTVGWGFSLTNNDTNDFLLVSNSFFCGPGQDPLFTTCAPALGASSYNDFAGSNGINIGPGGVVTQLFDAISMGVGEYVIDSAASPGQVDTGSITLLYDFFTGDPFDPNSGATPDGGTMEISADASVTVTGNVGAVPEPGLSPLLYVVLGGAVELLRRKRRVT